jgi:YfiR/HmsC-like
MMETRTRARGLPVVGPGALPRRSLGRCLPAMAVPIYGLFVTLNLIAQAPKPTEYEVEAAYLSNFGRFVEYPAKSGTATEPFNVCVLGKDPFGPLLDAALKGEAIGNQPMAAKRLPGPEDTAGCRILFLSSSTDNQLNATLAALGNSSVLTVSDIPEFTKRGGMIQFVLDGNRVRFEINIAAAQRAKLSLSSQLLKLAVAVRRAP